ncbi:MAG TPA: phosphotransferase [Thermotogota bacterium]|nr:phosphotransferase [Thermotogota bacterium]HRW93101.1 phosphotransferase [Thermotogota bacterium]
MKKILTDLVRQELLLEFCQLFSVFPRSITPLKQHTRCVYEVWDGSVTYILKLFDSLDRERSEIQGELDFMRACSQGGVVTCEPLFSRNARMLESLPLDAERFAHGFVYPRLAGVEIEEDENAFREFTPELLFKWGELLGTIHRISRELAQNETHLSRLKWDEMETINHQQCIPASKSTIHKVFQETIREIHAIPREKGNFGLVHGDLHYGNFFLHDNYLSVIDFDSSCYFYYVADIAIPLYSVLPYPRTRREERTQFAKQYLTHFLQGYRTQTFLDKEQEELIPLFLHYEDMANFIALYRHWDFERLSPQQKKVLERNSYHIENRIPIVDL